MVTLAPPRKGENKIRNPPRIEILGVFGSGKTTLSVHLSSKVRALLLPECHELNPLWGKRSSIENLGYLPYDLYFLLQHADLASSKITGSPRISICDWSFRTDRLWASMRLGDDIHAYDAVYSSIQKHISSPLGYLYLHQPVNKIIERIESRGRSPEELFIKYVSNAAKNLEDLVESMSSENVLKLLNVHNLDYVIEKIDAWLRGLKAENS